MNKPRHEPEVYTVRAALAAVQTTPGCQGCSGVSETVRDPSAAWDPDGSPAKSKPGEAVAMDNDFSNRMTRQQAEQAIRSFEFPGWVCLGIMDMTASEGGWGLIIAPVGEIDDFYVYVSWRLWIQEWQLECYYRARERAYMDELAVQLDASDQ